MANKANRFQSGLRKLTEEAASDSERPALSGASASPTRAGKKIISGYFDPAVKKQFAQIALDEDMNHQQVLAEALNLLFQSRDLPQIAR